MNYELHKQIKVNLQQSFILWEGLVLSTIPDGKQGSLAGRVLRIYWGGSANYHLPLPTSYNEFFTQTHKLQTRSDLLTKGHHNSNT